MKKIMLNLGEPAYPLPEFVRKELCRFLSEAHRFPSNYHELEREIAREYKVGKENVAITNGAHEAIDLVARVFGARTLVFTPAYIEYTWAPKRNNQEVKTVNAMKEKNFEVEPASKEAKNSTLIFLANPNNPFGYTEKKTVKAMLKNCNGIVAVDETYQWFKGESLAPLVKKYNNLLIIGSFSKSLSLAGMRVGYIIAGRKLLKKMEKKLVMFRVSSLAVKAAIECLKHKRHFKKNVERTVKERKKFEAWLEKRAFNVYRTENNNALVKFRTKKEATQFTKHLEKNGIVVLQGNGISTIGLNDSFVRITIGNRKEMKAVRAAILSFQRKPSKTR